MIRSICHHPQPPHAPVHDADRLPPIQLTHAGYLRIACYVGSLVVAFHHTELCLFLYFLGFFGDLLVRGPTSFAMSSGVCTR